MSEPTEAKQNIALKFPHLLNKTDVFLMVRYDLRVVRLGREKHFEMICLFDMFD